MNKLVKRKELKTLLLADLDLLMHDLECSTWHGHTTFIAQQPDDPKVLDVINTIVNLQNNDPNYHREE